MKETENIVRLQYSGFYIIYLDKYGNNWVKVKG